MIWTLLWIGWFALFVVVEGLALRNDVPGDTLSEHVRRWLRTDTKLGRTIFLVIFAGFAVWFTVHIITKLV